MRPEIAGVAPGFAGASRVRWLLDQLLSGLEAVWQPEAVFAGGQEPRAAQVETALAGAFGGVRRQWPGSSPVLKKLAVSQSRVS
jgi:hypothetical protein